MPNVPHDIPTPPTLVLDLESTLVSSTWDRKWGWRHAKRPGVDKFLLDMAQYYEIVLYSPSIDGIADPVVTSLDKQGCIMHRLYRDATYYKNGIHIKDLRRLNRNIKQMVVLDDVSAYYIMYYKRTVRSLVHLRRDQPTHLLFYLFVKRTQKRLNSTQKI